MAPTCITFAAKIVLVVPAGYESEGAERFSIMSPRGHWFEHRMRHVIHLGAWGAGQVSVDVAVP